MKEYIKSRKIIGWIYIALAIVYALIESWYFGWNTTPESKAEIIADILGFSLFYYGFGIMRSAFSLQRFISDEYEDEYEDL